MIAETPSPFWQQMSEQHQEQLVTQGFAEFKRTVNRRYFQWDVSHVRGPLFWTVLGQWFRHPTWRIFTVRFPDYAPHFTWLGACLYALYVALLYEAVRSPLLEQLEEPDIGHPYRIWYRGHWTSQDRCNAVHEYEAVMKHLPITLMGSILDRGLNVLEIGAGYGRVADVFLNRQPECRYTIVDIQPARSLAARYLTQLHPEAELTYLAPSQMEAVKDKSIDVAVVVSAFHEMTQAQVQWYFTELQRVCRGVVYVKHWRKGRAAINNWLPSEHDYPIPTTWRTVFHRKHPLQPMFFHALYEVA